MRCSALNAAIKETTGRSIDRPISRPIDKAIMPGKEAATGSECRAHLQGLPAIRERCGLVYAAAREGRLHHFVLDETKVVAVTNVIERLIRRDYGPTAPPTAAQETLARIPPHGRWRHFGPGHVQALLDRVTAATAAADDAARARTQALLDLFTVAVLLDAGAGDAWRYVDGDGTTYRRSEGLAVAALRLFERGAFSADGALAVTAAGLRALTRADLEEALQVTPENPLVGVEGRLGLLHRLAEAITSGDAAARYFPQAVPGSARPANLLDYLLAHAAPAKGGRLVVPTDALWEAIIHGFGPIWPPSRTTLDGAPLGDVWPCEALGGLLVPFHKLSQWLAYSLMEVLTALFAISFSGAAAMTGLAEYRNGGVFVDLGVIALRDASAAACPQATAVPTFPAHHQAIVEWRALTVVLVDLVAGQLRERLLGANDDEAMPLPKVLEAGTWKAGREAALARRGPPGGPPNAIISDGTLF